MFVIVLLVSDIDVEMIDSDSTSGGGSSESLVSIIGGAVGGALNVVIISVLIIALVIVAKHRTKQKLDPNISATLSEFKDIYIVISLNSHDKIF